MPTRTRPPASGTPRKRAGKPARPAAPAETGKPARSARPRKAARKAAPKPPAAAASAAGSKLGTSSAAAPAARPTPKVQRTCYEVRLMVCPRNPAACPETWPLGQRLLCGSFEMLARFERSSGGEDAGEPEAGLADALAGLSIRSRPDADPDEREDDPDDVGGDGEDG